MWPEQDFGIIASIFARSAAVQGYLQIECCLPLSWVIGWAARIDSGVMDPSTFPVTLKAGKVVKITE